jgi:opacity protein-like surface antigen
MRSWKIAVLVALAALVASTAFAAGTTKMSNTMSSSSSGSWTFGINGGGSFPTSDYGKVAKSGFNIGGEADYWMNSQWGFGADAAYHANNASDDANAALVADPTFGPGTEEKFSIIQYGVHTTYLIPMQGQVAPYLQGGVAGYNIKDKITGGLAPGDVSNNKVGFNIGGGVDFHATSSVNLGVGGTYHYVSADPTALNWFGVQGRVTFKMPTK